MTSGERIPDPEALIEATIDRIAPLDRVSMKAASERLDQLTKPQGSLGWLEDLAIWLAGASGCRLRKPGSMAARLAPRGLYFMVQEPSG